MKFAYADPPYFGRAHEIYGKHHPNARHWDKKETHVELVEVLCNDYPDGWALSCNSKDLAWILPHCPEDARVASWCKTWHQIRPTSTQWAWEPVIFRTIKKDPKRPMVRDFMISSMQTGRIVPGAKPHSFNRWVLDLLIFNNEEDTLDDIFPGSGGMQLAINEPKLDIQIDEDLQQQFELVQGDNK
jgi:hypothetical protein